MDQNRIKRNQMLGAKIVKELTARNMEAYYTDSKEEALKKALELIPEGSSISWGGSMSVNEIGLKEAVCAGPRNVLMIIGMNKVTRDVDSAMSRARNEAAPINAQRFNLSTPCCKTGACFDCKTPDTICCQILITRYSKTPQRIKVILVNEDLGF